MTTDEWVDLSKAGCGPAAAKAMTELPESAPTPSGASSTEHSERLRRTIETQIVPRLIAARARGVLSAEPVARDPAAQSAARNRVEDADCTELQRLLLAHDTTVAGSFVDDLIRQGVPREVIYTDLLAPVARGFGQMWDNDEADFTQITVALGRLQVLLHRLSRESADDVAPDADAHSVLLMPTPGEQHTFGLLVIGEFFRRRGWNVSNEFPKSGRDITELVADQHFDVIGFSLACERRLADLAALIAALRRESLNPKLRILVGGPAFTHQPALVREAGADATAADGAGAVAAAEQLLGTEHEMH